jgi:hypothetical protein
MFFIILQHVFCAVADENNNANGVLGWIGGPILRNPTKPIFGHSDIHKARCFLELKQTEKCNKFVGTSPGRKLGCQCSTNKTKMQANGLPNACLHKCCKTHIKSHICRHSEKHVSLASRAPENNKETNLNIRKIWKMANPHDRTNIRNHHHFTRTLTRERPCGTCSAKWWPTN